MVAIAPLFGDRRERGMSARRDRTDWIGGFPYEFATLESLVTYLEARGFTAETTRAATQPRLPRDRGEATLMCGLAGFSWRRRLAPNAREQLARMTGCLAHRGPDAAGEWIDLAAGIALGHRRLSILDLSSAGSQPMHSHSGRYVLVTNGEIYNHLETRARRCATTAASPPGAAIRTRRRCSRPSTAGASRRPCAGRRHVRFRGLGPAGAPAHARPRPAGREAVVLRHAGGTSALRFRTEGSARASRRSARPSIASSSRSTCTAATCRRRAPSTRASASCRPAVSCSSMPCDRRRARFRSRAPTGLSCEVAARGLRAAVSRQRRAMRSSELEQVLSRAVASQSVADVPLGAFLSGGIDSSTVVALMQAQSSRPVRTFAIGFQEDAFNEAPHARAVAAHLGTEHTELIVTPQDAMERRFRGCRDCTTSRSATAPQIPTFLVAELARRHVTVSLSGDGGDELFGGYTRYARGASLWAAAAAHAAGPAQSGRAGIRRALLALRLGLDGADSTTP